MLQQIATTKKWVMCPGCRKKQNIIFDNTAHCRGVYLKCRHCKEEFKLNITDGVQK